MICGNKMFLGQVLEVKEGKTFRINSEDWGVFFELYENGYLPIVYKPNTVKSISLLLSEKNVEDTLHKLNSLEDRLKDIPFLKLWTNQL